jgi:segregation and condensation protein B
LNTKDRISHTKLIEALLFLENRPVNIKYIAKVTNSDNEVVQKSIIDLKNRLNESGSSLIIEENERGDFHLTISPHLYDHLADYYNVQKKVRLSTQALETLAIVAYKQPITKSEIERIRGVQVGYILKVLLEHGIIRITGKKDTPGRPLLYGTTDKFLKYFGLLSIKDLPPISEFERL